MNNPTIRCGSQGKTVIREESRDVLFLANHFMAHGHGSIEVLLGYDWQVFYEPMSEKFVDTTKLDRVLSLLNDLVALGYPVRMVTIIDEKAFIEDLKELRKSL